MNKVKAGFAFVFALLFLALFALMTYGAVHYDVQAIGPNASYVGYASVNNAFNSRVAQAVGLYDGLQTKIYRITEYLGYLAVAVCGAFGVVGLVQWISRKSLKRVDPHLWLLLGLYVVMAACYVLFELVIINYRPVLEDGQTAASFPSSHTVLVWCVMGSAMMQFPWLLKKAKGLAVVLDILCVLIMILMPLGRLASGVHWVTDVAAGIVLSCGLLLLYSGLDNALMKAKPAKNAKAHGRHGRHRA